MGFEVIGSQNAARLEAWDEFNMSSPRGHYCTLATWLASFRVYGFDFAVLAASESGRIVGGVALLEYRRAGMCIVTCPVGPNVELGRESLAAALIQAAVDYARRRGAVMLQMQLPFAAPGSADAAVVLPPVPLPATPAPRPGYGFRTGSAPGEMVYVSLPRGATEAESDALLLARFTPNRRSSIRSAERLGVHVAPAETDAAVREAYSLVELNAREKGYAVRSWGDVGDTVREQIRRGHAVMLAAYHEGRVVAANYGVLAGRRFAYCMGGTLRTETNLNAGSMMHWQAMRWSRAHGLDGYDFGSRGPAGVREFKMGFGPELVQFARPVHYVFAPMRFYAFARMYPWLRRHKSTVAGILRRAGR